MPIQSPTSNILNSESPAATLAGSKASSAGNQPTAVTISSAAQHTYTPAPSQIISVTTSRSNILTTNTAFSPTQSIALTTTSIKGAVTTAASSQLSTTTNAKSVSTSAGPATTTATTNSQTQNVLSTTKGPSTTAGVATAGASSTAAATTTASTQTTKAVPFPDCPAVACQQEPAKVSESQLWKSSANGDFYSGCSKQYFISKAAKKRDDAMIECCKYGLKLLSIDSFDEIACIIDFNLAEAKETGQFWTSGSNLGDLTQNTPGWCTTKTFLPSTSVWFKGQPNNPSTERCISFQMSATAVGTDYGCHDNTCTNLYRFICEGDVPVCNVTCPRNCPSKLDKKLFNSKNQLMDSNSYGRWITGCGSTYLFSNTKKFGWTGSYDFCCSMGMSMVKIETQDEFKCLFDLNKNEVSLKFNGDFWTSASQLDCAYKFEWCDSGVRLHRNDTRWWPGAGGQPNNLGGAQACTFLHFQPGVLPTDGYLNDWDCGALYDFICEMPAIANSTTVTCNDVLPCSTDANYAQQLQTKTSRTGKFFEACSRTYFFSSNILTYDAAFTECCKYGLQLVSFETLAEFQCVLDLNNANMKYAATFWTSGTNDGIGMENSWGWCPSGKLLESGFSWKTGEPNNIYTENCLALSTAVGDYSLSKIASTNCKLANRYICEAA
ncbi:Hypothetical predicted protein [Cloeon dipterum]|nr:Hypothetical predicted protein [Cloeon dipterum]